MHDWFLHYTDSNRIHWRYDDPSGVPDALVRGSSKPVIRRGAETGIRAALQALRLN